MVSIASAEGPTVSDREHYLAKVAEVGPLITESLDAIERDRRLPSKLLDAMQDAGLFRMLLPKEFGEGQLKPSDLSLVIAGVAEYDASVAGVPC